MPERTDSKKPFMPMWRYEIISLFREAYNRGELKLPKEQQATCPNKTAFNRWLSFPIRFPALMKNNFGVDPLECILCKSSANPEWC